ncbi:ribosome recycling factor [Endozoicomonas elysicola]|uniref:Ribosome-recycling factor n=1 Tax=Endozoicomonas elysicola TaxID=305900 RepID=A0A081KD56_9GAMM|nr:ribosome recycling factor [Endozoicomonas elysicola]KEI72082.1 ribosome-recycling factor [Endozoicomonas elysicola]
MINEIKDDAKERMGKTIESLTVAFNKIRTGRAHPSLLDGIKVSYYGSETPLSQMANISVEDGRTLAVRVWERQVVPDVEKAIMKSDLGLNPSTAGEVIRIPLPPLTEETRKGYTRQARQDAENARIAIRNIRRDALADIKELEKEKMISEDDERRGQDDVQKLTDHFIAEVDKSLSVKENDLMAI